MRDHPEQKLDETYLGNRAIRSPWPDARFAGLTTMRLGVSAYDLEGKRLPEAYELRPMFVGKVDHDRYDRIMMDGLGRIMGDLR